MTLLVRDASVCFSLLLSANSKCQPNSELRSDLHLRDLSSISGQGNAVRKEEQRQSRLRGCSGRSPRLLAGAVTASRRRSRLRRSSRHPTARPSPLSVSLLPALGSAVSSLFSCAEKLVESLDVSKLKEIKSAVVSGCHSLILSNKCEYQRYEAKVLLGSLGDFLDLGFLSTCKLAKPVPLLFA